MTVQLAHHAQVVHRRHRDGTTQRLPRAAEAPTPAMAPSSYQRGGVDWPLTPEQTAKALGIPVAHVRANLPYLLQALGEKGIRDRKTIAGLLAITARESTMTPITEKASGRAYEGRRDLGNTHPGDGVRYKGRGYIQLTGRANYALYSRKLGVDLVGNPDLANRPDIAARITAQYMVDRGMPALAHRGHWQAFNQRVAGGDTGLHRMQQRVASLNTAMSYA